MQSISINGQDSQISLKNITQSFQNPINLIKQDKEISLKKKISSIFSDIIFFFVMDHTFNINVSMTPSHRSHYPQCQKIINNHAKLICQYQFKSQEI